MKKFLVFMTIVLSLALPAIIVFCAESSLNKGVSGGMHENKAAATKFDKPLAADNKAHSFDATITGSSEMERAAVTPLDMEMKWNPPTEVGNVSTAVFTGTITEDEAKDEGYFSHFDGKMKPTDGGGQGGEGDLTWDFYGKLDMVGVAITSPDEDDVYLHGSKCVFKAETDPVGLDVEWKWEIVEGSGRLISEDDDSDTVEFIVLNEDGDFESPDIFKIRVTARVGDQVAADELQIKVVYPRIESINFTSDANIIHEGGGWPEHDKGDSEWIDADHDANNDHSYKSVSVFERGKKLKLEARFKTKLELTDSTDIDKLYARCLDPIYGNPDCKAGSKTISGDETEISMEGVADMPNEIYAYNAIHFFGYDKILYEWKYTIEGEDYQIDPQPYDNVHHVYLTLKKTSVASAYETILYITCGATKSDTQVQETVDDIWGEFSDREVRRIDGAQMKYWDGGARGGTTTGTLLNGGNGNCQSWAALFRDCLRTHGLTADVYMFLPRRRIGRSILVKDWKFIDPFHPGGGWYPYRIVAEAKNAGEASAEKGIPGQGNPDPPAYFNGHWITLYVTTYYDPSYGTPPVSGANKDKLYEDSALDGFGNSLPPRRARKNDISATSASEVDFFLDPR